MPIVTSGGAYLYPLGSNRQFVSFNLSTVSANVKISALHYSKVWMFVNANMKYCQCNIVNIVKCKYCQLSIVNIVNANMKIGALHYSKVWMFVNDVIIERGTTAAPKFILAIGSRGKAA